MERAAIDSASLRRSATNILLPLVLLAYLAVVLLGALVHEPWWDEAQAWLIARDAPATHFFVRVLRYEGHPPLWYLLLAIPARLHLPYISLQFVAALAGAVAVWLLLFRCRAVPLAIRLLLPFSFFFAYQNTVVARSYILFAPILIALALLHERRSERFGLYVALLILLANTSAHGTTMSCAIAALLAFDVYRGKVQVARKTLIASVAVFVVNLGLLAAMLWPPSDNPSYSVHHSVLDPKRYLTLLADIFAPLLWGAGPYAAPVAIVFMVILMAWLYTRRALPLFLLTTAATLFVSARYYSLWHESIFFFLILYAVVAGFSRPRPSPRWLQLALQIALVVVLLRHMQWTVNSLRYDMHFEFTGSERAAEFIQAHRLDRYRIAGMGVRAIELQPYFDRNLFSNYRFRDGAFWDWSSQNTWPYALAYDLTPAKVLAFYEQTLAANPDFVVTVVGFGADSLYGRTLETDRRYQLIGTFPGRRYWKDRQTELTLFQIFVRRQAVRREAAQAPATQASTHT